MHGKYTRSVSRQMVDWGKPLVMHINKELISLIVKKTLKTDKKIIKKNKIMKEPITKTNKKNKLSLINSQQNKN